MAPKVSEPDKKIAYDQKLCQLLDKYTQVLIAAADNVGSNQLQSIRRGLRGDSVVLMGKNALIQMTEEVMRKGKDDLVEKLSELLKPSDNQAFEIIRAWSLVTGTLLTPNTIKGLASALQIFPELEVDHLKYILLGWELRGEHDVNEVKNVADAMQELLNNPLSAQREFKASSKGLTAGFEDAMTKMMSMMKESTTAKPPLTTQPMAIDVEPSDLSDEKSVKTFLNKINKTTQDLERFFPGNLQTYLEAFLNEVPDTQWNNLLKGKGVDNILSDLSQYAIKCKRAREKEKGREGKMVA